MKVHELNEVAVLSWSGGKDSALALYELINDPNYHVRALLTTITSGYDRISMHGVRRALLEQQAATLGVPLKGFLIPQQASNEAYESELEKVLEVFRREGVTNVAFGDLFLEEIEKYREEKLAKMGMKAIFPLWKVDTKQLARSFIRLGFKAVVTCVDSEALDKSSTGKLYDKDFLARLPANVDPCGENGEFHTFVFDGPIFNTAVGFNVGEVILRDNRFYFCDLMPADDFHLPA